MGIITFDENKYYVTNKQLKIVGYIIELREFGREFFVGDRPKTHKTEKRKTPSLDPEEIQNMRYRRAKRDIFDYIHCNSYAWPDHNGHIDPPIFVTFTFAENITDLKTANYEFTKFIQRLNYFITNDKKNYLKYLVVVEFQKRGAVHYHALFFNMPFIKGIKKKIEEIWAQGFIKYVATTRIKNLPGYLTKYMTKDLSDPRLNGKKSYFVSRGLKKPQLIYYDELVDRIIGLLPKNTLQYEAKGLEAGFMETVDFARFDLSNHRDDFQRVIDFIESTGYDGPSYSPTKEFII